ncbi:MAG: acyl-CoA dehydrogenase family protein [Minicystis sp.]
MIFTPSDEQRAFGNRFERMCQERIAPRAREADRSSVLPASSWSDLRAAGYLGLFHPPELGGSGADGIQQALAMESLARACASTFWAVSISTVLCGKMLHTLCGPRHHRAWLGPIITGDKIGCFAATEQGAGSDPGSYQTTVRQTKHGYRLSGEKSRVSNAGIADVAVVLARREGQAGSGLCYAVVDLEKPGIRRREQAKLGLSAMSWGALVFDDVEIDPEDVIVDASMEKTLQAVEWGQLLQTFCAVGLAEAALQTCLDYASKRHAFGRPIGHLQVVHARLADMRAEIDAARLLATEVAWVKAQGGIARESVIMAKIYATEMAVRVADGAMRTLGGWGYSKDHVVERLYRDSLANVPAGLPTDRLRELLACAMVGVDPWVYEPFDWLSSAGLRIDGP